MTIYAFTIIAILTCNQSDAIPCQINENDTTPVKTADEKIKEKIVYSIFDLPEVKEENDRLRKESNGKLSLNVMFKQPQKVGRKKCYWGDVIEISDDEHEIPKFRFSFYVFLKPYKILFFDREENKAINLSEWRQNKKNGS